MKQSRRGFIGSAVAAGALGAVLAPAAAEPQAWVELPMVNGRRPLEKFPQKRFMIVQATRPPILETPFVVFDGDELTPNEFHFVRWHLAGIPDTVDLSTFRLGVGGLVNKPLTLSVDQLRKEFSPIEIVAVNQCAGNSRGLFDPRVPGGEWANGAMSNARWKGARLKDVLARAGIGAGAKQVAFNGLDKGVLPATPQFRKALDVDVATGNDALIAYEMNGKALPLLNGFPIRLVVPGWFGTYWVKMLNNIEVIDHADDNFWMATAYRIPDTPGNTVTPRMTGYKTIPINKFRVRSFISNIDGGTFIRQDIPVDPQYPLRFRVEVRGIAFDSGSGIKLVEFSDDGGKTWTQTLLDHDLGPYSFRKWRTVWNARVGSGARTLACKATANSGETQTTVAVWNPAGYLKNNIETYKVTV